MALLSTEPEVAVVFVHGFLGDPRLTWINFQSLVDDLDDQRPLWNRCDLFFYDYRSRDQIAPLAEDFRAFLKNDHHEYLYESVLPSSLKLPRLTRGAVQYKHLILVGHSVGAVIIRDVVLQDLKARQVAGTLPSWTPRGDPSSDLETLIPQSSLRFFAPAHLGVLAAGKLGLARSIRYLDKILEAYLRSNPLYQNLRPGSPTLVSLQRETEAFWAKYPKVTALQATMFFGQHEDIVEIGGYSNDEFYGAVLGQKHTEPGHNHTSICKPSVLFTKPMEFVAERLTNARSAK